MLNQFIGVLSADAAQSLPIGIQAFLPQRRASYPEHETDLPMSQRKQMSHHLHPAPGMIRLDGIHIGVKHRRFTDQDDRIATSHHVPHFLGHTVMKGQNDQQAIHTPTQHSPYRVALTHRIQSSVNKQDIVAAGMRFGFGSL